MENEDRSLEGGGGVQNEDYRLQTNGKDRQTARNTSAFV